MKTGGIILAAGLSSRMGFYKPLADINGKPMVCRTIDSMLEGGVDQIVLVTGHNREKLTAYVKERYSDQIRFAFNENYENGKMFDSVVAGIRKLSDIDAFYILLADMPGVRRETFFCLKQKLECSPKQIILPVVDGFRRHPPLIDAALTEMILSYNGEGGMRGFWRQEADRVLEVPIRDAGCTLDVDVPEDLERMKQYLQKKDSQ